MLYTALDGLGLTPGEVKVYLKLLELGPSKTGPLARGSKVSSSKIYKILDRLHDKGLVGHVIEGRHRVFSAMEPKRLLDYVDEKESTLRQQRERIVELMPFLTKLHDKSQTKSEAILYDGFKAVTNFFRSMIDELGKGDTYFVIGATYGEIDGVRDFFWNHHKIRSDRGIHVKMLANFNERNRLEETTQRMAEIRYLPQYLFSITEVVFYQNKTFFAIWTKDPKGFLIDNEEVMNSFKKYFEAFWMIAKP